jgi:outer membrane protein TolC
METLTGTSRVKRHIWPLLASFLVVFFSTIGPYCSARAAETSGLPPTDLAAEQIPPSVDSDAKHELNKSLDMSQLRLHTNLAGDSFKTIRLEVRFDQSITLQEALSYAVDNNLAIKISKDNLNYQKYLLYGQLANALPNLTMSYNLTQTKIINEDVRTLARVFLTRVTYPVFQGGSVLYSILGQYYREKGWGYAYKASFSDAILDVYQKYSNLVLARVLLQIQAKAVEVNEEQLRVNIAKDREGTGARFQVIQTEATLAAARQALLQQEVAVRQAALALNFSLNYPMGVNLVPVEETISEQTLFQNESTIDQLLTVALKARPELREYELFKLSADRNVQVAAAGLYPQASFFNQYSYANTTAGGGSASTNTAGAGVFGGKFETYIQGFGLVYSLSNMGLSTVANIAAAGSLRRQAGVQANQELLTVCQQVRSDWLNWRAAREQIDNAAHGVAASKEELRLAQLRLKEGIGTNLEFVQAESDYVNSLTTQAQAIVNSNLAQAQLLHDLGVISSDTLIHGFKGNLP